MAKYDFETKVSGLSFINTNGTSFIGEYVKTENGYSIEKAVSATGNLESDLKRWLQAEVTNQHNAMNIEGNGVSIATRSFTESQMMTARILAMKAEAAVAAAVPELQASAIETL